MGVGRHAHIVYLINFGLSKEFQDPNTHLHIPFKEGLGLIGTTAFTSINSYLGSEQGRQDDLESLAYILFYFMWGFLLWQGLGQQDILESKWGFTPLDLFCELLPEFRILFEHFHFVASPGHFSILSTPLQSHHLTDYLTNHLTQAPDPVLHGWGARDHSHDPVTKHLTLTLDKTRD